MEGGYFLGSDVILMKVKVLPFRGEKTTFYAGVAQG